MNEEKSYKVKLSIIKKIYDTLLPVHYRVNSLLEDVVSKTVVLNEMERSILLEYCSCTSALKVLFESYFEKAHEKSSQELILSQREYLTIISMSKTAEEASRSSFGPTTIWEH